MAGNALLAFRRRLNPYFDDDARQSTAVRVFNILLATLIVVNVGAIILESVDAIREAHRETFRWIEHTATSVFVVEYVLRAWTSVDRVSGAFRDPFWGRLKYLRGFFALVDLVAVLPAVLGLLGASDFRVLRLLRLLRMLKLTRHSTIFGLIGAVIREEAQAIGAVVFVLCLILTLSASLMYMIEGEAQPLVFDSIPAAMWWAVETITTVGYGDMVPVTVAGRILGGIVSVLGILSFAMFSGIITVGFMEQLKLRRAQYQRLVDRRVAKGRLNEADMVEMERLGDRLGLPEEEAEETIIEAEEHAVAPDVRRQTYKAAPKRKRRKRRRRS
jgi:voltage-gated potassium channel